ncbi:MULTISPECIES: hypothetical protein [unclassified Streptomyces]|uniref:hypothetical protein n=1 Tax=unclassified Streptomyces TaxID=2593676 RepID=UPI00382D6032
MKLGVQFKNSDDHTYDPDWIATRTAVAGKYARATQYFTTNPGWCVRATMQSGGSTFISKWLCY